tara:strand:- start:6545 stop:8872 length:2328 start_codon:yes stop_codon:yes gene_type:complete
MAIDPSNLTPDQLREKEELLRKIGALNEEEKRRLAELQGLLGSILDAERKRLKMSEDSLEASARLLDALKDIQEANRLNNNLSDEDFVLRQRQLEINRQEAVYRKESAELAYDQLIRDGQISDSMKERLQRQYQSLDFTKLTAEELSHIVNNEQRRVKLNDEIMKDVKTMDVTQTRIVKLLDKAKFFTEEQNAELRKQVLLKRANEFIDNVAIGLFGKMKEALFAMDEAQSSFNKNFQFGPEYTGRIRETYKELNQYGVGIKEAAEAQAALINTVTDFTMMSEKQRDALTESAALASKLGVSNENFARGIQASTKFFGQNVDSAIEIQSDLAASARALGVSQEVMSSGFAQNSRELAKFGSAGVATFKNLARVAKITGLEIERLLSITNKFDTFEGAAEQAGKLNAALGGNFVNAMDLMMATDPVERFNMIRDSILDTGLSFDDMSYYQKNFYKDALGLSDVGELALMLSGNTDMLTGSLNASGEELVEQKKRAADALSVQEKFQAIIADNAEGLTAFAEALNNTVGLLMLAAPAFKFLFPIMIAYRGFTLAMGVAQTFFAFSQMAAGNAGKIASRGIIVFALAVGLLAAYMMFASPSKLVLGLFAMAAAFGLLSLLGPKLALGLTPLGASLMVVGQGMLMISGAVAIVIGSVGLLTLAITGLFDSMTELAGTTGLSSVAKEIKNIAESIEQVPVIKAIAFKSVLDSAVVASNVTAPTAVANNVAAAAGAATAGGGAGRTVVKQPIQLNFDGKKLSEFVTEVIGEQVKIVQSQTR